MAKTKDTFVEAKNYTKVVFQDGKPVISSELNELQDIIYTGVRRLIKEAMGDGYVDGNAFRVHFYDSTTVLVSGGVDLGYYYDGYRVIMTGDVLLPVTGTCDVVLKFEVREVGGEEDPDIVFDFYGDETTRRLKVSPEIITTPVAEYITGGYYDENTATYYVVLATIENYPMTGQSDITDQRWSIASLQTTNLHTEQLMKDLYSNGYFTADGSPILPEPIETTIKKHKSAPILDHSADPLTISNKIIRDNINYDTNEYYLNKIKDSNSDKYYREFWANGNWYKAFNIYYDSSNWVKDITGDVSYIEEYNFTDNLINTYVITGGITGVSNLYEYRVSSFGMNFIGVTGGILINYENTITGATRLDNTQLKWLIFEVVPTSTTMYVRLSDEHFLVERGGKYTVVGWNYVIKDYSAGEYYGRAFFAIGNYIIEMWIEESVDIIPGTELTYPTVVIRFATTSAQTFRIIMFYI